MLGDVLNPPASTRPKYGLEAPQELPTPGSPFKKALMLAILALSSGLLLILPEDGEESYSLGTETESGAQSGQELSPPTSFTEVAGETGVVSEADTARLALATEAALVGADPSLSGGALAMSLADEIALAEQALDALSPSKQPATSTTQAPTTAAPTTAAPTTQAPTTVPPTTVVSSTEAPTTAAETTDSSETTDSEAAVSEAASSDVGAETTVSETLTSEAQTSETTVPEATASETTISETTVPETTAPATSATDGWVDTGNGVMVPQVLIEIRWCESRGDYEAANPSSSARGGYQFLTGSWKAYGHKDRYGVSQAHLATPAQQDEAALITWERDGTRPWNASKSCWSKRI